MKKLTREELHNRYFKNVVMNRISQSDDEETIELLKEHYGSFKMINKDMWELSMFSKELLSKYFVIQIKNDEPEDLKTFLDREIEIIKEFGGSLIFKKQIERVNYLKEKYIIDYDKSNEEYFVKQNVKFNYKRFKRQFIFKYYLNVILNLPMNIFYYYRLKLNLQ